MNVVLNTYAILRSVGSKPDVFDPIAELVRKHAIALLVAQLKSKTLNIARFRATVGAIGLEPFELFLDLDTVDAKVLKVVLKNVDPHCAEIKSDDVDAIRSHLLDLATDAAEPALKPAKVKSAKATKSAGDKSLGERNGPHAITAKPPRSG